MNKHVQLWNVASELQLPMAQKKQTEIDSQLLLHTLGLGASNGISRESV